MRNDAGFATARCVLSLAIALIAQGFVDRSATAQEVHGGLYALDPEAKTTIDLDIFGVTRFEADTMSWSFSNGPAGEARSALTATALTVTKAVGPGSTALMLFCARGETAPEARLVVRKTGDRSLDYLVIDMREVRCRSYLSKATKGLGKLPTEQITLRYAEFEFHHVPKSGESGLKLECVDSSSCTPMEVP